MKTPQLIAMQKNAGIAAATLKALSHKSRLMAVCHIASGPKNVHEMEQYLGLSQANVSQHLAKLRNTGIVKTQKEGNQVYYTLADRKVMGIIRVLQDIYCK